MNCDHAAELIEAFVAGDLRDSNELSAHVAACPRCAAALSTARQVEQWLASGRAQPSRHFTANVLSQLPPRTSDITDPLEAWLDTATALSLVPVFAGIWLLADPALLRRTIDAIRPAFAFVSSLTQSPSGVVVMYAAVALVAVMAVLRVGLFEEA
jgi:anti-sigma factor RsiW